MAGSAIRNEESADNATIRNLAMMLDCAIADGARLRLPMFVWLIRLARIELVNSTESRFTSPDDDGAHEDGSEKY